MGCIPVVEETRVLLVVHLAQVSKEKRRAGWAAKVPQRREILPQEQRYEVGEDIVRSQDKRRPQDANEECGRHARFTGGRALPIR